MSNLMSIGAAAAAQRFNAACPPPKYVVPADASWLDLYPAATKYRRLVKTMLDYYPDAVERWGDLALPEHERESARQQHIANREACEEASIEAEAWRLANIDSVVEERRAARAKMIPAALALLDQLEVVLQGDADAAKMVARFRNDHRGKRDAPMSSGQTRLPGNESLSNLRRGIEALLPKPPKRYVSPAAFKRLEQGLDVEDIEGNALSFAEAEALHKDGRLQINHGKHAPRGVGGSW